jgi:type IV pilus assembly protein PilE
MKKYCGMTLLELLIVLVIISVLAVIATEMYKSQIYRSKRTDGINSLYGISTAEERYRATNTTYGTLAQVWSSVATSTGGFYTLAITTNTATNYTITATAVGKQASDTENGTSCAVLTLSAVSGTITQTPTACWPS